MRLQMDFWKVLGTCVLLCGYASQANAQVIYYEDFADETLQPNTTVGLGTVANGIATFLDDSTGSRSRVAVVQPFTDPVMTFSFDVVDPVVVTEPSPPNAFELLFRAGIGTSNNSLGSGDQIIEGIAYRTDTSEPIDHTRGAYENNGNETIFIVTNNQNIPLTFTSPIDGTDVNLLAWEYIPYVLNNDTATWGTLKGVSAFATAHSAVFGTFERFAIGTSSSGHLGGFGLDNVLVMAGATFERPVIDAGVPGDVDGDEDVDMDDFAIIQSHFQQAVTMRVEGDLNLDNFVDFRDFRQWKSNAPAPVIAEWAALGVPEPSSVLLAGLALAAGAAARRRKR
jgi:hypothetical protein